MLLSFSLLSHYEGVTWSSCHSLPSIAAISARMAARCSALYLHFLVNLTHSALAWVGEGEGEGEGWGWG